VYDGPDMFWTLTDAPFSLLNSVLRARLAPAEADSAIEAAIARCVRRRVPMHWLVGPTTTPANLGQSLAAHGFARGETHPCMAVSLPALEESAGFDAPGPLRCFLGRLDGEPVATSFIVLAAGVAGLYGVGVLPEARRQGLGTTITLEGSIQPATLLTLASRNGVSLPASSVAGLRAWYQFSDFTHFIEVYFAICACIRTPADLELIAGEFLRGQAEQNIRYSEVIFTPYTHYPHIPFAEQLAALGRAGAAARARWGVEMRLIPDISRDVLPLEHSLQVADWAIQGKDAGIIALGLGGPEIGRPPELFEPAFARGTESAGLKLVALCDKWEEIRP